MKKLFIRFRLWRICRAVGIKKLTRQQKDVLLTNQPDRLWYWGRQSGKTTTAILHTLLYQRSPIELTRWALHPAIPDPDGHINHRTARFTTGEFARMHALCCKAGIKVCKITLREPMRAGDRGYMYGGR